MFNKPSCTRIAPRKSQESKVSSNPSQRHYRISTTIIKNFWQSLKQRRITDPGIKSLLRSRKWFYTPVSQSLPISPSSPAIPSFPESLQPMLTDVQPHAQHLIMILVMFGDTLNQTTVMEPTRISLNWKDLTNHTSVMPILQCLSY